MSASQKTLIVTDDGEPDYLDGVEAQYSLDANGNWVAFVKNGEDARRLAACWNACEGMATDELEEIARTGGMLGPREDVAKIAEQRDKLRDVLLKYSIPIDTKNIALSCIEYGSDAVERELQRRAALSATGEPQ